MVSVPCDLDKVSVTFVSLVEADGYGSGLDHRVDGGEGTRIQVRET